MVYEGDVQQEKQWYYEQIANRCITALKKNNINACYASDRHEARAKAIEMIPKGATICWGDSVTMYQTGLHSELVNDGQYKLLDPFGQRDKSTYVPGGGMVEELLEIMRKGLSADVFISGTNAVTLDGKLVNVDGLGNRVAGIIFGPKKVIIV
ncbi:lactate utilization protein, partial [Chloroflexota bacterium]